LLQYTPTPIQEIHHKLLEQAGVKLLVKREDLNHPYISGNKWWKLKYNLHEARQQNLKTLLTFGGAYSNHIYATAAAAKELNFESVGVIRGEETLPLNTTLTFAKHCGMKLHYIDRTSYRKKDDKDFLDALRQEFGEFFLIPEGGTNSLAVCGCSEFAQTHIKPFEADYVCLAVGTGGTMAGIVEGLHGEKEIIGFPVLKGGEFLQGEIENLINNFSGRSFTNWKLDTSYHHGGYAKTTKALMSFIDEMKIEHDLPLDHVYTGKLMWAVMDYVEKGKFQNGATILVLHSGGLQGTVGDIVISH
jgi:1-aminocyclopropane-1-carboxylate deaminase